MRRRYRRIDTAHLVEVDLVGRLTVDPAFCFGEQTKDAQRSLLDPNRKACLEDQVPNVGPAALGLTRPAAIIGRVCGVGRGVLMAVLMAVFMAVFMAVLMLAMVGRGGSTCRSRGCDREALGIEWSAERPPVLDPVATQAELVQLALDLQTICTEIDQCGTGHIACDAGNRVEIEDLSDHDSGGPRWRVG